MNRYVEELELGGWVRIYSIKVCEKGLVTEEMCFYDSH